MKHREGFAAAFDNSGQYTGWKVEGPILDIRKQGINYIQELIPDEPTIVVFEYTCTGNALPEIPHLDILKNLLNNPL